VKWGLSDSEVQKLRDVFAQSKKVQRARIFGSRVLGTFKPGSDIDIALEGEFLDQRELFALAEFFYESDLPYQVDLCDFANISHQELRDHINTFGEDLYAQVECREP
jgi:uncharacterized protein